MLAEPVSCKVRLGESDGAGVGGGRTDLTHSQTTRLTTPSKVDLSDYFIFLRITFILLPGGVKCPLSAPHGVTSGFGQVGPLAEGTNHAVPYSRLDQSNAVETLLQRRTYCSLNTKSFIYFGGKIIDNSTDLDDLPLPHDLLLFGHAPHHRLGHLLAHGARALRHRQRRQQRQ